MHEGTISVKRKTLTKQLNSDANSAALHLHRLFAPLGITNMNLSQLIGFVVGAICFLASNCYAQLAPDSRSAAYMWPPEMQKRLHALGLYLDKNLLGKAEVCSGKVWIEPISVGVVQPLFFPEGSVHPTRGMWTIRYRFDRCNESITYNALFRANAQGPATIFDMPPGTTLASPQLMRDLNPALYIAASSHNKDNRDCKVVAVMDTSVTKQPASLNVGGETIDGVWEEQWTVRTCSGTFSMPFCFIPQKAGGTIWKHAKCESDSTSTTQSLRPQ